MMVKMYNGAYHSSINNTPHYLMFLKDMNIPYSTILPPVPHVVETVKVCAAKAATCLELAQAAIASTQNSRMERANLDAKNTIDIGSIVFARTVYTGRRDTKLLPKYYGPFRVVDLQGNTAFIKSLSSGRISHVSLRNVKLVHHSAITKTEHDQADAVFPTGEDTDFPASFVAADEVKSYEDMCEAAPGPASSAQGQLLPPSIGLGEAWGGSAATGPTLGEVDGSSLRRTVGGGAPLTGPPAEAPEPVDEPNPSLGPAGNTRSKVKSKAVNVVMVHWYNHVRRDAWALEA